MEEENLSFFLKYGCNLGLTLGSHLKLSVPPYWVRSIEKTNHMICSKISSCYEVNGTPESRRFPNIRSRIIEIYNLFEDVFSEPLIVKTDSEKKTNTDWLKFEGEANFDPDIEEEEKGDFDRNLRNTLGIERRNRGLSIILQKKTTEDGIDAEFPISEMFYIAILLKRYSPPECLYPYCVLYFIYGCVYHSVPGCSPQVYKELQNLRKFSKFRENKIEKLVSSQKSRISGYMKKNSFLIEKVGNSIEKEVELMTDQDIDSMGEMTKSALNSNESFLDMFRSVLGDNEQLESLKTENLREKIVEITNTDEKTEETKSSIDDLYKKFLS